MDFIRHRISVKYKSFLAKIVYYHTNSAITYRNQIGYLSRSYNNDVLRLSIGFK